MLFMAQHYGKYMPKQASFLLFKCSYFRYISLELEDNSNEYYVSAKLMWNRLHKNNTPDQKNKTKQNKKSFALLCLGEFLRLSHIIVLLSINGTPYGRETEILINVVAAVVKRLPMKSKGTLVFS